MHLVFQDVFIYIYLDLNQIIFLQKKLVDNFFFIK
jgi:hypothetical protein